MATISMVSLPAGFSIPVNYDDNVVVTVTAPETRLSTSHAFIGDELQKRFSVNLMATPPNPVDVTIEVIAPTVALISKDPATEGSSSITFAGITNTSERNIYIQGLDLGKATQVKVSAPGYQDWIADVDVVNSGFRLAGATTLNIGQSRNLNIQPYSLNANFTPWQAQNIRGGASFSIDLGSTDLSIGTFTTPIVFTGGNGSKSAVFTGVASGTTTISITQPAGFTEPASSGAVDMTVN